MWNEIQQGCGYLDLTFVQEFAWQQSSKPFQKDLVVGDPKPA
jgi:hypothetical protein